MDQKIFLSNGDDNAIRHHLSDLPHLVDFADEPNYPRRSSMEDMSVIAHIKDDIWLYAVLDGHGGDWAAKHFSEAIPSAFREKLELDNVESSIVDIFVEEDRKWMELDHRDDSGATFTGILITSDKLYTINLGDSRTIVRMNDEIVVTPAHKPKKEWERITQAGGKIFQGRISGILNVSRALGDISLKQIPSFGYDGRHAPLCAVPEVKEIDLTPGMDVLIASDGLFERINPQMIFEFWDKFDGRAQDLVDEAIRRQCHDNVSVITLKIRSS